MTAAVPIRGDRDLLRVGWITLALFLSYLSVAMSLPVTSLHVTTQLGFGNALAGLAVGAPFASTLFSRGTAGHLSDHRGGKTTMARGLCIYVASALVCLGSDAPGLSGVAAYGVLCSGRLLQGIGESLTMVGLLAWGFGLAGPHRSGRVIAMVGMGMYGAFAAGGPLGLVVAGRTGFAGVMIACTLAPLLGLAMIQAVPAVAPQAGARMPFRSVLGRIRGPGAVVCLQGIGFAAIGAFMPLMFLHRGWSNAGLGLTCFGVAFVAVRLLFGHLPDRVGGLRVAIVSMAVECIGQALLWAAPDPAVALAGAFLTGLGCSMIFPAMGVEAVRRIPSHLRGTAMGGIAAFQDLAYGLTGPVTGLLADRFGYGAVFLVGSLAALLGFATLLAMARSPQAERG